MNVQAITEELKTHFNQQLRNFMETMLPTYLNSHLANVNTAAVRAAPTTTECEEVAALKRAHPKMLSALRALEQEVEAQKRQRRNA